MLIHSSFHDAMSSMSPGSILEGKSKWSVPLALNRSATGRLNGQGDGEGVFLPRNKERMYYAMNFDICV